MSWRGSGRNSVHDCSKSVKHGRRGGAGTGAGIGRGLQLSHFKSHILMSECAALILIIICCFINVATARLPGRLFICLGLAEQRARNAKQNRSRDSRS